MMLFTATLELMSSLQRHGSPAGTLLPQLQGAAHSCALLGSDMQWPPAEAWGGRQRCCGRGWGPSGRWLCPSAGPSPSPHTWCSSCSSWTCAAFCKSGQLAQHSVPAPYSPLTLRQCCCCPFTTVMLHCFLSSPASLAGLQGPCAPGRCPLRPFAWLPCHASGPPCLISSLCCRGSMGCGLARWQALLLEVRHAASAAGSGACQSLHVTESNYCAAAAANLFMIARVDWRIEAERACSRQSLKGRPPKD